jgi:type II secretory pathway component GspD/PulD (secretin)
MSREKSSNNRFRFGKDLFVWSSVLIVMAAIAVGQVEQGPAEGTVAAESVVAADVGEAKADVGESATSAGEPCQPPVSRPVGAETGAGKLSTDAKIPSISFKKDMRIQDALQFLAARYQKNIVPSAKVDGLVTVTNLYDVTFEQALSAILGSNFKYDQEGDFIRVYTTDEFKKLKEDPDRMTYKVFTLYYITGEEAKRLLKPILSSVSKVESSSPAEKNISSGSGSGGGTSGGGGSGGGSIGSGGGGDSMALNDVIVVYDYPENLAKAEQVIKALDIRPRQVLVEATILSATLTEGMKLGVDWNLLAGVGLTGAAATTDLVSNGSSAGDLISRGESATTPIGQIAELVKGTPVETSGFATPGQNGLRFGIRSGNVAAFITALETVTDLTILANPKILAVNKQEGSVQIGKTLGYRGSSSIGQGGIVTQGEVQFLPTGTVLVFRPYIGNDGYIRMDIYPKDSTAELNADKVPDETTTQLKTNVLVKDGETIVIGGLFRDSVKTVRNQVPLLGDLPLVGALFRGTEDVTGRQEVIVLLTPHIVNEPADVDGKARAEDIQRKRFGAKDAMQDIDRAKLAENHYANAARFYIEGDNGSAMTELSAALTLRPTYLEAIRLKEKIISQTDPDEVKKMERNVLENLDREEAPNWQRR